MKLYLTEDHTLPLIQMNIRIEAGTAYDPEDRVGLVSLATSLLRSGGTPNRKGEEIDEHLDSLGATMEIGADLYETTIALSSPAESFDAVLQLVSQILTRPAFPQSKLDQQRIYQRALIPERQDSSANIAWRHFKTAVHGANSPIARRPTFESLEKITREDLVDFHKKYLVPGNSTIVLWGDFETRKMVVEINRAFNDWKGKKKQKEPVVHVTQEHTSVNLVRKEGSTQSAILIGHTGTLLNDPDLPALEILSDVLAGGSSGRLFRIIRSEKGFAYTVSGKFGAGLDYPPEFYVGAITRAETTTQCIRTLLHEIGRMRTEEVSDEEFRRAKESYVNSIPFQLDTTGKILNRIAVFETHGYPKDFHEKTKERIENVTKENLLHVAQRRLNPDRLTIVVVGDDGLFAEPLSVFGKVTQR